MEVLALLVRSLLLPMETASTCRMRMHREVFNVLPVTIVMPLITTPVAPPLFQALARRPRAAHKMMPNLTMERATPTEAMVPFV